MSDRALSTLDLIQLELVKCEKLVVANKPEHVSQKEIEKYMKEFREWKPEDFFVFYRKFFWEVNKERKRVDPKYVGMDPVAFTWDLIDQMWPFVKQVKAEASVELGRSFALITALFDTILK